MAENLQEIEDVQEEPQEIDEPEVTTPKAKGRPKGPKYNERYVLSDGFGYQRLDLNNPDNVIEQRLAMQGEKLELTDDQVLRHEALGHVGSKEQLTSKLTGQALSISGERIEAMTPTELLIYLGQNSDNENELNRIESLELARPEELDGPRQKILDAIELIRELRNS